MMMGNWLLHQLLVPILLSLCITHVLQLGDLGNSQDVNNHLMLETNSQDVDNHLTLETNSQVVDNRLTLEPRSQANVQLSDGDAMSYGHTSLDIDTDNCTVHFEQAEKHLQMGNSQAALLDIDKVLDINPDFQAARMQKANILLKQGSFTEALTEYNLVMKSDSGNSEAKQAIENISKVKMSLTQAQHLLSQKYHKGAMTQFSAVLDVSPWYVDAWKLRAEAYLGMGKSEAALFDMDEVLKLKPDFQSVRMQKANILLNRGNFTEAQTEYNLVLKFDSSNQVAKQALKKIGQAKRNLSQGQSLLSQRYYKGAMTQLSAVLDVSPWYVDAWKLRAEAYLGMGKSQAALFDMDEALKLKPAFQSVRMQKANILLNHGNFTGAQTEYNLVLKSDSNNMEAKHALERISQVKRNLFQGRRLMSQGYYREAIAQLSTVLDLSPWYVDARELRAEAYIKIREFPMAIMDIKSASRLVGGNFTAIYRISELYYQLGNAEQSLSEVRECLKQDPDHKECLQLYRKVKKIVKLSESIRSMVEHQDWNGCLDKAPQMLKPEPQLHEYAKKAYSQICHCTSKKGNVQETIKACKKAIGMDPHDVENLYNVGDVLLANGRYEEAVRKFQEVLGKDQDHWRAKAGLHKAQNLLKQSKRPDYYKILGVNRSANKNTIMKAYRKLARKWHPDKFRDEDKKKEAEKKFHKIAAAKEVLTDPKLRQRFDNGEDPLDPNQHNQQGGAGNPFQDFNPFSSGGFHSSGSGGQGQEYAYRFYYK